VSTAATISIEKQASVPKKDDKKNKKKDKKNEDDLDAVLAEIENATKKEKGKGKKKS